MVYSPLHCVVGVVSNKQHVMSMHRRCVRRHMCLASLSIVIVFVVVSNTIVVMYMYRGLSRCGIRICHRVHYSSSCTCAVVRSDVCIVVVIASITCRRVHDVWRRCSSGYHRCRCFLVVIAATVCILVAGHDGRLRVWWLSTSPSRRYGVVVYRVVVDAVVRRMWHDNKSGTYCR